MQKRWHSKPFANAYRNYETVSPHENLYFITHGVCAMLLTISYESFANLAASA
jgi:hypothetical protein